MPQASCTVLHRPFVCSCLQCGIPGPTTVMSVSLVDIVAGERKLTGASVGGRADVKVRGSAGCLELGIGATTLSQMPSATFH